MTVTEALQEKSRLQAEAETKADQRTRALHRALPELKTLDEQLSAFGPALVKAVIGKDPGAMKQLESENRALQAKRRQLLTENGYRPDEDEPLYACKRCRDSGYVNLKLCDCVRSLVAMDRYTSAGLGKGLSGKTFENFSLRFYLEEDRKHMETVLSICRSYAEQFDENARPLLFIGKTGLGKTHLSAAIAATVAKKGYDVLYETAQKLFDRYEAARFGRDSSGMTERYESCDLLLIDDLGTECGSQYASSAFFNLLNTRLLNGQPIIINTNLNRPQLEKAYGERVLSRLLGDFRVLRFVGTDVRMQKVTAGSTNE